MSDEVYTTQNESLVPTQLFDRELEEALIGAILINPDAFVDVSPRLNSKDFYINRHEWIWDSFKRLLQADKSFDIITVKQELESAGKLEESGGMDYLISLTNRVPSSLHAETYAEAIKALAIRRRLLSSANEIAKIAHRKDLGIETVIEEAEKAVFGVSQDRYSRDLVPLVNVVKDYSERIQEASLKTEGISGLETGLRSVDLVLDGLQKSDLIIVAGRPGMGKTGFLLGIAKHVGMRLKRNVAIFSLEMSNTQLLQRMVAQETDIDSQKLRSAKLSEEEWTRTFSALSILGESRIFIDDTPAITPLQMRSKCQRLKMEEGLDLVIVDYLQLMSGDTRSENRVQEVSYISRNLKVLARDLEVPVLAAAQLSRAVEHRQDKQPVLSDLRESGSLEQDADIVMFINRPDQMNEDSPFHNLARLAIAKHRNGPTHPGIELVFIERLAMFRDAVRQEYPR
jgi:replicative DNA helicase